MKAKASMFSRPITQNTLFYGDNLPILRDCFTDACVDLIYLDQPFNSNRLYNVLFKDESGGHIQLLGGAQVDMPPAYGTFKRAAKINIAEGKQSELGI